MQERVYISGKMSGTQRSRYLAEFRKAEELVRGQGYHKIVNPIRFPMCRWPWIYKVLGYKLTLLYDLWRLMQCDRIYKIPGWRDSKGAMIESYVACVMRVRCIPNTVRNYIDTDMEVFIHELDLMEKEERK